MNTAQINELTRVAEAWRAKANSIRDKHPGLEAAGVAACGIECCAGDLEDFVREALLTPEVTK